MTSNANYPSLGLRVLREDWTTAPSPRRRRGVGWSYFIFVCLYMQISWQKSSLSPASGLAAQALTQDSAQPMPGNRHSTAVGTSGLEMLAALPLGLPTAGDFKDRAQSTEQSPKCLGNCIWQLQLDEHCRNDLAQRRRNVNCAERVGREIPALHLHPQSTAVYCWTSRYLLCEHLRIKVLSTVKQQHWPPTVPQREADEKMRT